jgi:glutamate decarboxylase
MGLHRGDHSRPGRERASTGGRALNALVTAATPALDAELVPPTTRLADDPVPAEVAYQLVHDELLLDGNARLNLATFVTTWMEPQAARLMAECADKNMIDKDEYPQTAELERRCVAILADLWHAPDPARAIGCSTTGSSEAAMLAGLALQRRWARRTGDRSRRPNLVMGANVQVCWEKFCRYWDVEPRLVPMEGERFHLGAEQAVGQVDENTIGVVAILGSTFDGSYEPIAEICAALDQLQASGGPDVPVHVDAASGGFIAPFLDPELEWDFRLARVASINASGHKYGLVYPGVGWALWRDQAALPEELVFDVNYLGGHMPTFALNFSRPGAEVVAQYYNLFRLGRAGYTAVQAAARDVATSLAAGIEALGEFRLLTRGDQLPVFAFTTTPDVRGWDVFAVSRLLRERGWQVPAYTFPANRQDLSVLRVVVRNGFGHDLADLLLHDIRSAVEQLTKQSGQGAAQQSGPAGFHH